MIRRSFRIGLLLGLLAGVAFALSKVLGSQNAEPLALPDGPREPWPRLTSDPGVAAAPIARPVPDPVAPVRAPEGAIAEHVGDPLLDAANEPPKKKAAKKPKSEKTPAAQVWVEPTGNVCPTSHPVKAKLASKIFHLPGMMNYDRTKPDRCYPDAARAEADGLRAAKR